MCEYVNQNSSNKYSSLNNYYKNNGLIVSDIVLGFNVVTDTFVYNNYMLNDKNVIKLYSPLENSKLNEKIILSRNPVILYKIMYNNKSYNLGTFSNGTSLTYYINEFKRSKSKTLEIYYSYYNNNEWIDDMESLDMTSTCNYNNESYYKWEVPRFMYSYYYKLMFENSNYLGYKDPKNSATTNFFLDVADFFGIS
jgi:hypothetical protein